MEGQWASTGPPDCTEGTHPPPMTTLFALEVAECHKSLGAFLKNEHGLSTGLSTVETPLYKGEAKIKVNHRGVLKLGGQIWRFGDRIKSRLAGSVS